MFELIPGPFQVGTVTVYGIAAVEPYSEGGRFGNIVRRDGTRAFWFSAAEGRGNDLWRDTATFGRRWAKGLQFPPAICLGGRVTNRSSLRGNRKINLLCCDTRIHGVTQ